MTTVPPASLTEETDPGAIIARRIRQLFPEHWEEAPSDGPGHWLFIDRLAGADEEGTPHGFIDVEARSLDVPVFIEAAAGGPVGPRVTVLSHGSQMRVILPDVVALPDLEAVVRAAGQICHVIPAQA
ncbi:hypothetical protein [Nocardia sp. NBC_00511]|uniref:hypothetical protein n=1 Tax=Nocardia sp. NBC_00511 TaxID=2903591 RepID=UPI0030DEEF95